MGDERYTFRRKLLAGISAGVVGILILLITWFIWKWLAAFSPEGLRDYIRSFGAAAWLVFLILQVLQVFIALIPGELLESVAGFVFGPVFGTLLCYAGIVIASSLVFLLTRKFGVKLVEVFISREKINQLRFLNTAKKRDFLIFLAFFIPGTPKDLLTYFVGLTEIRFGVFLAISLVARIPSVVTSTFGGHLLGEGEYLWAVIVYAATALISLFGMMLYNKLMKKKRSPGRMMNCQQLRVLHKSDRYCTTYRGIWYNRTNIEKIA